MCARKSNKRDGPIQADQLEAAVADEREQSSRVTPIRIAPRPDNLREGREAEDERRAQERGQLASAFLRIEFIGPARR
jgi:hypothetical protein